MVRRYLATAALYAVRTVMLVCAIVGGALVFVAAALEDVEAKLDRVRSL
ncbi:hypothetical protein [Pseudooceanicola sp.]